VVSKNHKDTKSNFSIYVIKKGAYTP